MNTLLVILSFNKLKKGLPQIFQTDDGSEVARILLGGGNQLVSIPRGDSGRQMRHCLVMEAVITKSLRIFAKGRTHTIEVIENVIDKWLSRKNGMLFFHWENWF